MRSHQLLAAAPPYAAYGAYADAAYAAAADGAARLLHLALPYLERAALVEVSR